MRYWSQQLALFCVLATVLVVPGCGKKGPLYIPTEPKPPAAPAKTTTTPDSTGTPATTPDSTSTPDASTTPTTTP